MLITKTEAARQLGIKRQATHQWKDEPFFVDTGTKIMIDSSHPAWIARLAAPRNERHKRAIQKGVNKKNSMKRALKEIDEIEEPEEPRQTHYTPPEVTPEIQELTRLAAIAEMQDTIYAAKIKEEKSKQEEIKTLELKRDLAPMYLVKHFFTFAENMIQRAYRRYNELSPELEALYLAGKKEQAVKFLLREQESITRDAVDRLIKAIKDEGYEIDNPSR